MRAEEEGRRKELKGEKSAIGKFSDKWLPWIAYDRKIWLRCVAFPSFPIHHNNNSANFKTISLLPLPPAMPKQRHNGMWMSVEMDLHG